ncbi:MAG TPA: hypothetical protein PLR45_06435 [Flavobacteriales bacterium]|nr:hypothetical protein [Flavobacteriales bacterium]
MKKYRKEDQYYEDQYDRSTIKILKEMEGEIKAKGIPLNIATDPLNPNLSLAEQHALGIHYRDKGALRAQNRKEAIIKWKQEDEYKDRLIETYIPPKKVNCKTCNARMELSGHLFKPDISPVLFVFQCPLEHKPNKVLFPDGDEYFFPKRKCEKCNGDLVSSSERKETVLICKDECKQCGHIVIDEYDLTPTEEKPITIEDRKKYCEGFKNSKTFTQSLKDIAELAEQLKVHQKETEIKQEYNIDQIEKPTIPQVEQRLTKLMEELGYIKFQFGKPDMGAHVIIEFSVQDPTNRSDRESEKLLIKSISENLFPTFWRLMKQTVSYRLGYITGKVKCYADDGGLLKIGKEIKSVEKMDSKINIENQ